MKEKKNGRIEWYSVQVGDRPVLGHIYVPEHLEQKVVRGVMLPHDAYTKDGGTK